VLSQNNYDLAIVLSAEKLIGMGIWMGTENDAIEPKEPKKSTKKEEE